MTKRIKNYDLWIKFGNEKNKNKKKKIEKQLVEIYYPLVQKISYKIAEKIGWRVSPEELSSSGVDGLYSAIDRFSLDRGVNFPTFANRRISGSMIDNIRKEDIIPRSVRINNSLMEKIRQEIETKEGRKVTEYEVVEKLGIDQKKYLQNIKKYSPLSFVSLEGSDISNENKQDIFKQDTLTDLADRKTTSPFSKIIRKEFFCKLVSKGFSRLEQKIVYSYYYENLTMGEIGEKLGTSESRISQIHADILIRLKDKIERNPKFFGKDIKKYIIECNDEEPLY